MQGNIKPRFEVHAVEGTTTEKRMVRDAEKHMNVETEVEVPYGYDVFFPNGNSMRVRDHAELVRLGFARPASLIDMESGEEVGTANVSLRHQAQRRPKKRADVGAADAGQEA